MANIRDSIDIIVDRDYQNVVKDARLSCNQLRTRPDSFKMISSFFSRFRNWRVSGLNKKLEKEKNDLINDQFSAIEENVLTKDSIDRLNKKTKAIAELEQRIMFISKDVVPRNFVNSRAIKLRNKMFANFIRNSEGVYSVGQDNYSQVFGSSDLPKVDVPVGGVIPPINQNSNLAFSADEFTPIGDTVDSQDFSPEQVKDVIDERSKLVEAAEMSSVPPVQSEAPSVGNVDESQILAVDAQNLPDAETLVVDPSVQPEIPSVGNVDESQTLAVDAQNLPDSETLVVGPSVQPEIPSVGNIDESQTLAVDAQNLPDSSEHIVVPISPETVSEAVRVPGNNDSSADVDEIQRQIDSIVEGANAKLNGSSPARSDHFDNDGQPVNKYFSEDATENHEDIVSDEWVSLTDEDILKAQNDLLDNPVHGSLSEDQINADFESYQPNNVFVGDVDSREDVLVVPDRDDGTENIMEDQDEVNQEQDLVDKVSLDLAAPETAIDEGNNTLVVPESSDSSKSDQSLHFDYTDATLGDIARTVDDSSSLEDFKAIRDRVEVLKRKQKESADAKARAEEKAREAAARAEEAARVAEERQAVVKARMAKLLDYEGALQQDCEFNENRAAEAQMAAEASEQIIEERKAEALAADDLIAEIDSVIAPEAVNVVAKGR